MRSVALVQPCRLASSRLPNKALELVDGERLIDRACRQLRRIGDKTGVRVYLAASETDGPLVDAALRSGVEWLPMTFSAAASGAWEAYTQPIYNALKGLVDWVGMPNLVCMPFLRDETIIAGLEQCRKVEWPFDCCISERNKLWTVERKEQIERFVPTLGVGQFVDTKNNPRLITSCHAFTGVAVSDLGITLRITNTQPWLPALKPIELVDIDTQEDLEFARIVAAGSHLKSYNFSYPE